MVVVAIPPSGSWPFRCVCVWGEYRKGPGAVNSSFEWFLCPGDPAGCQVAFADTDFVGSGRDALYYVRAIEAPSEAVGADPLGCRYDDSGRCVEVNACSQRPEADDCLGETEERAWSSPIYVDQPRGDAQANTSLPASGTLASAGPRNAPN